MPTIEEILRAAKEAGASDVHLTVGIPPKMRVNGNLITMDYPRMLPADTLEVLVNIMTEVQRERFEERGEYDMSFSIPNCGRYRVNAYKQRGSVALAFRLVGTKVPSPEELGVPESVIDLYQRKRGLVLVTGPTGSGKSTTLYATLGDVAKPEINIITVEDPVEFRMRGINQVQVNNKAGMTFAAALRSILRADPDVVLIGEIRDQETANIAIEASLTGHLVLSTLHTNDAPSAVTRLTEMGVEPFLLSSSLAAVMAQRLARRLCKKCKRQDTATEAELRTLGVPHMPDTPLPTIWRPVGCRECANTGYSGRVAIQQVMGVDSTMEDLIARGATSIDIDKAAKEQGMTTLRKDGWQKALQGITSVEEVLRVTV